MLISRKVACFARILNHIANFIGMEKVRHIAAEAYQAWLMRLQIRPVEGAPRGRLARGSRWVGHSQRVQA